MTEHLIPYIAFLWTLHVLTRSTDGSNHHKPSIIHINPEKQSLKNGDTYSSERNLFEWRNKRHRYKRNAVDHITKSIHSFSDSLRAFQQGIKEPDGDSSNKIPWNKNRRNGFFNPNKMHQKFPHEKHKSSFNSVKRGGLQRLRQEIEFLDDNNEERQEAGGSPRFQDETGSENAQENNGYGNGYVTIIENDDDKSDTDPYNTLSSDLAKSEYTNVENSMNEGENEESEMLGKEVNDLMGTLTKSDAEVNQFVGGGKETPVQSNTSPVKEPENVLNDDVIVSIDRGKETGNSTHSLPTSLTPADVTLIEDQEEPEPGDNSLHHLSNEVWDIIQQAQQNFTDQNAKAQASLWSIKETQNNRSDDLTQRPQNNSSKNVSHAVAVLKAKASNFGNSNLKFRKNITQEKPGNMPTDAINRVFFTGDAEEGTLLNSAMNQSSNQQYDIGYNYPVGENTDSLNSSNLGDKGRDGDKTRMEATKFGPHIEENKADQNNHPKIANGLPIFRTSHDSFKGNGDSVIIQTEDISSKGEKQNSKFANNYVIFKELPGNVTTSTPPQYRRPVLGKAPLFTVKSNSNSIPLFRPVPVTYKLKPANISLTSSKLKLWKSLSQKWQPNRTVAFHDSVLYNKPYRPYALTNQNHKNNGNKVGGLDKATTKISWTHARQESDVDSLPNPKQEFTFPSIPTTRNTGSREPENGEPKFIGQVNHASVFNTYSVSKISPKASSPQNQEPPKTANVTGNRSLESWSTEYQKLVDKLKELFVKAHGNPTPDRLNETKINDVEKMMQEVSRFHNLFVNGRNGRDSNRIGGESKVMFIEDEKGEEKGQFWKNIKISKNSAAANHNLRTYGDEPGETRSLQRVPYSTNLSESKGKQGNTTSQTSKDNGPSSHQVLMSYFRNETSLRKHLQKASRLSVNRSRNSDTAQPNKINNEGALSANNTTRAREEASTVVKDESKGQQNSSSLSWPFQERNKEEDEGSLAKFMQEFISLLAPNKTIEPNTATRSTDASTPVMGNVPEASKKENVTDMNNRIIIEVSPNALKYTMKEHSDRSSPTAVQKGATDKISDENGYKLSPAVKTYVVNETSKNSVHESDNSKSKAFLGSQSSKQRNSPFHVSDNSTREANTSPYLSSDQYFLYRKELKSLEISLSQDFMSDWIYYQKSLDEIGITPGMLRSGIANLGSPKRLSGVFRKALAGADINVLIVGGSISAGGGIEKDRGNVEGVYHKALSDWWNKTVTPITTSQLKINAVAIGGTDSEYFSYCVKNYMRSLPDIVIWELAANDYQRYTGRNFAPAKPLEQLTRIILSLPSHPALIFANFFRGNYYRTTVGQDCPDSEDEGGKTIAEYYKLTALSWRNVICSSLAGKELELKKLFSSDGYHPSILGHAQMSTLLISYLKGVFEETISQQMIFSRNHTLGGHQQDALLTILPKPIFDMPVSPRPYCWTLLTPDYDTKLRNTLPDLEFTEATGFQFANISHWPVRRDRLRCLRAIQTGAMLKMAFVVPSREEYSSENRHGMERELAIATHNSFGGSGTIWIDEDQSSAKEIKEQGGQRRTQVDLLTRFLAPGRHTLTVNAIQPGFCLSAIAVL